MAAATQHDAYLNGAMGKCVHSKTPPFFCPYSGLGFMVKANCLHLLYFLQ